MAVIEQVSIGSLAQGAVPPGYTFTRSTAALYVDSDGLLKWSAHNLALWSEDWANAAYSNYVQGSGVNPVTTANAGLAPDGTLTADRVDLDCGGSTANDRSLRRQGVTVVSGQPYAGGFWIKAATPGDIGKTVRLLVENVGAQNIYTLTGSWVRVALPPGNASSTTANIYVECRGIYTSQAASVLIWGTQVNKGLTLLDYTKTTSAARYDSPRRQWDATNRRWGYVGEGSRTNLLLQSILPGGGSPPTSWTASSGSGTATASLLGSADGASAYSFTSAASRNYFTQTTASLSASTSYCLSVWVESVTGSVALNDVLHCTALPAGASTAWYLNGVATSASANVTTGQLHVLIVVAATPGTGLARIGCGCSANATGTVVLSRPQLEAGPAPSSYIPTTTIALSRGADLQARALTGPEGTALSTQGTMVVEFSYLGGGSTIDQGSRTALEINNATTAERIRIYNLSGTPTVHVVDGGANQSFQSVTGSPTVNAGVITRVGVSWALNDVSVCVDGSAVATDATATMPTVTTIGIGGYPSSNTQPLFGLIYGWTIYDDAKTDAELQVLSSQTKRGVGHWRTLDGTHRTAASPDKTVAIILEAECDLNTAGLDGIERVEFHYNVNGGSTTKVTKTARELLTYNCTDGSLNGLTKTWAYGFLLDCTVVAVGTIVVRATIFDNAGGVHQVPAEITVYNDTDGTDRRPSSAVVYYDHDAGDDTTGTGTTGNPFKTIRAAMNSLSGEVGGSTIRAKTRTVGCTASGSYSSSAIYTTGAWALTFEAVGSDKTIQRLTPGTFSDPQDYILGVDNTSVSRHLNLRFKDFEFVGPGPTVYANDRKVRVDEINCLYRSHAWTSSDTKPHVDYEEFGSGGIAFSTNTASVCRIYSWGGKWRGVGRGPQAYSGLFDFSVGPFLGVAIGTANNFGNDPCYTNGEVFGVRYIVGELDGLIQTNPNFTQLAGVHVTVSIQATGPHTGKMRIDATDSTPNDFGTAAQQLVGSTRWGVTVGSATTGANNGTFAALEGGLNGLGRPYCILNNASAVPEVGSAGFNMDTGALVGGARYIDAVHTDVLQIEADHNDAMFAHIRAWDCHNTRTWVGSGRTLRTCIFKNLSDGDSSGAFDFGSGSTTLLDCLFLSLSVASTAISFVGTFTGTNFVDCVWAAGTNIPTSGTFLHSNHYIVTSAGGTAPSTGVWFNSTPSNAPFDYSPSPGNRGTASGLQDAPPFWYHTGAVAASRGAWKNVATGNWSTSLGSGGGSTAKIPYLGLGVRVGFL